MPRHSFRFSELVREQVKKYVFDKIIKTEPKRYNQESQYTVALIQNLEGIAYEGDEGFVSFRATAFDDRGQNSSESILGADFVITASISDNMTTIRKAILVQAKLGLIEDMSNSELEELEEQIELMKQFTRAPKVMETEDVGERRFPRIISGNKILGDLSYSSFSLEDYIVRRVLTTFDGDTRQPFVEAVQDSKIPELRIKAFSTL